MTSNALLRNQINHGSMEDANSPTPPGTRLGKRGLLEVRLARSADEITACQALRYQVFYEEMDAQADDKTRLARIDADSFDPICDHLLVIDHSKDREIEGIALPNDEGNVVGTYRLLRQVIAERHNGFYTASEFDIAPLLERKADDRFLELGRSCVLKPYRIKPTVELLWQGIWSYVRLHRLDVMFGCASLEGVDPDEFSLPLSYLFHHHQPPDEWQVKAMPERFIEMNRMPSNDIDLRQAMRSLPPLIKGYLRLGAYIGNGAVIDHEFNTIDVIIILPVSAINERYHTHFGAREENIGSA